MEEGEGGGDVVVSDASSATSGADGREELEQELDLEQELEEQEQPVLSKATGDGLDELTTPQLRAMLNDMKRQLRKYQENAILESYLKRHVSVRRSVWGVVGVFSMRALCCGCRRTTLADVSSSTRARRPRSPRSSLRLTR